MKLAAPPLLGLAVDQHAVAGEVRPRLAARLDDARDLEQRPEADHLALDLDLAGQGVVGAGFEPAKAEPMGLQPIPFDRSGTPPGGREV